MIGDAIVGEVTQDASGVMSFRYDASYDGPPLSLSMPVQHEHDYGQSVVRPYLFGLLPDSREQRDAIADEYDISPNNPVTMLAHIGLDCPGAVRFHVSDSPIREGWYEPVSDEDISRRLRSIRTDDGETWLGTGESWSLGGNQGKFALALVDGKWCSCQGSAPTTHIFKNGVLGLRLQALNEFVCMRTAEKCGISVAHVDYALFGDEPAIIVERYDRLIDANGVVRRIHQEDLCQSLGVMPDQKYTMDGGPSTYDVLKLLSTTDRAEYNLRAFTQMIFFNYLIGAPDAHAKNYSVILGPDCDALLAPMYDVASGLAYDRLRRRGRLAMPIGGENRFGRVGSGAIRRYCGETVRDVRAALSRGNLSYQWCHDEMSKLATAIPSAMEDVFDESASIDGSDELREHLLAHVVKNCETTLAQL